MQCYTGKGQTYTIHFSFLVKSPKVHFCSADYFSVTKNKLRYCDICVGGGVDFSIWSSATALSLMLPRTPLRSLNSYFQIFFFVFAQPTVTAIVSLSLLSSS